MTKMQKKVLLMCLWKGPLTMLKIRTKIVYAAPYNCFVKPVEK